jgi:ribosomal protein S21
MKVDVPPGQFDRALKKFLRLVRSEGVLRDVMDREAFTPPGEERRIKRRRAIKRRVRADAKLRELDTLTTAPMTYVERSQERLRHTPAAGDRNEP